MEEFILDKIITIVLGLASFGGIYILNHIKDTIQELKNDQNKLIASKAKDKKSILEEIKKLEFSINNSYVRKDQYERLFLLHVRKHKLNFREISKDDPETEDT